MLNFKFLCIFAPDLMKQFVLLYVKTLVVRFFLFQNNTPPMPLTEAHLGGFFFLGYE